MLRDFFNNIGATQPFATGAAKVGNPYPQQSFYVHGRTVGFGSTAEIVSLGESVSCIPESRPSGKSNQSSLGGPYLASPGSRTVQVLLPWLAVREGISSIRYSRMSPG